jgi:hypothetical protein
MTIKSLLAQNQHWIDGGGAASGEPAAGGGCDDQGRSGADEGVRPTQCW